MQHVAYDYAKRLAGGRLAAEGLISAAFSNLTGYGAGTSFVACDLSNVTICPALESGQAAVVIIYNQQSQARAGAPVRIPVGLPTGVSAYVVTDSQGNAVTPQLLPLTSEDTYLRQTYYSYASNVPMSWLAFQATVPAMGYAAYFLTPQKAGSDAATVAVVMSEEEPMLQDTILSNGVISLTFSATTGLITSYSNAQTGLANFPFSQTFAWWNSSTGNFHNDGTGDYQQKSGAYIFRPNNTEAFPVTTQPVAVTFISSGPVVWEARQTFANWATQTVRLWAGSAEIEFEYTIGPIPTDDGMGKEIISRYSTSLATASTWTSDSNGRDQQIRVRNKRRSFNYTVYEPVRSEGSPLSDAVNWFERRRFEEYLSSLFYHCPISCAAGRWKLRAGEPLPDHH